MHIIGAIATLTMVMGLRFLSLLPPKTRLIPSRGNSYPASQRKSQSPHRHHRAGLSQAQPSSSGKSHAIGWDQGSRTEKDSHASCSSQLNMGQRRQRYTGDVLAPFATRRGPHVQSPERTAIVQNHAAHCLNRWSQRNSQQSRTSREAFSAQSEQALEAASARTTPIRGSNHRDC